MSLPHEKHDEEERKHGKEGHHTVYPAHMHSRNPGIDIEADGQPKDNAISTNHDTRFSRIFRKALDYIVDGNRHTSQGSDGNQEYCKGQDHIMQMILQCGAEDPKTDGIDD